MALCSLSTGRIDDTAPACCLRHQRTSHDEHFLVRQRDGLASLNRGEHRFEPGCPGRRADHDIDVGMRRNGQKSFGARQNPWW